MLDKVFQGLRWKIPHKTIALTKKYGVYYSKVR